MLRRGTRGNLQRAPVKTSGSECINMHEKTLRKIRRLVHRMIIDQAPQFPGAIIERGQAVHANGTDWSPCTHEYVELHGTPSEIQVRDCKKLVIVMSYVLFVGSLLCPAGTPKMCHLRRIFVVSSSYLRSIFVVSSSYLRSMPI